MRSRLRLRRHGPLASCALSIALAWTAGAAHAVAPSPVPADSSAIVDASTAVLCEALVFIDYAAPRDDRMMIGQCRRVADQLVAAAVRALRRSGRAVGPALYASSGILLDPGDTYRFAWERPGRERTGDPPFGQPPFHADAYLAAGESTLADWRDLAKRVTAHDSTAAPEVTRVARYMRAGELLVVIARGSRSTVREHMKSNPLASAADDERLYKVDAGTTLDLALYEGGDGRRLWAFTARLSSFAAASAKRLADWTEAALERMPPPGTQGRLDDARTPGFRAPYRGDLATRLGGVRVGRDNAAFLFGVRAAHLFRPWISAGFQLDWQRIRPSRFLMGGSGTLAGVPFQYRRDLHDVELDLFPFYPVLEVHLPRFAGTLASSGVSGGYALAFLEASDYELQILGAWGWAAHAGLRWRSPLRGVGIGLEGTYQRVQPERDGTDPLALAPVRERLDLDGWGLLLSLNVWQ